jgi:hypothetical protein
MIASHASWMKRNAPSQQSFCLLALLSMLIAAPAFLMIRLLEPELVLPAFSILLFSDAVIAAIVARMNSANVTLWDIAGAFTMMVALRRFSTNRIKWHCFSSNRPNNVRTSRGRSRAESGATPPATGEA